jgi:hypothetical protein
VFVLDYNLVLAPYVVGINPNSPRNPHSAPASGGTDVGHIDDQPPTEAHVLYGAVVGGPDKHDKYCDIRSDWVQTEVRRVMILQCCYSYVMHSIGLSGLQCPSSHAGSMESRHRW